VSRLPNEGERGLERRYGVGTAAGETVTEGDVLAAGDGAAGCTKSARSPFKSGLLIANVPSCSSVRAIAVPSGEEAPTVNLC
jgi:hypothetical protein